MHSHTYGIVYGDFYGMTILHTKGDPHAGVIDYALTAGNRIRLHTRPVVSQPHIGHADTVPGSYGDNKPTEYYQNEGNTTMISSMDPYVAVYIWRRTA